MAKSSPSRAQFPSPPSQSSTSLKTQAKTQAETHLRYIYLGDGPEKLPTGWEPIAVANDTLRRSIVVICTDTPTSTTTVTLIPRRAGQPIPIDALFVGTALSPSEAIITYWAISE